MSEQPIRIKYRRIYIYEDLETWRVVMDPEEAVRLHNEGIVLYQYSYGKKFKGEVH